MEDLSDDTGSWSESLPDEPYTIADAMKDIPDFCGDVCEVECVGMACNLNLNKGIEYVRKAML